VWNNHPHVHAHGTTTRRATVLVERCCGMDANTAKSNGPIAERDASMHKDATTEPGTERGNHPIYERRMEGCTLVLFTNKVRPRIATGTLEIHANPMQCSPILDIESLNLHERDKPIAHCLVFSSWPASEQKADNFGILAPWIDLNHPTSCYCELRV